ncbi:MAG: alanine--tRNA ligase [Nanoarchaeota archaeon]
MDEKRFKEEFRQKASVAPEKFYAVDVLKEEGYQRKQCPHCKRHYWSIGRETCGDPACAGGYTFFDKPPAKKKLDYLGVWNEFAKHFKKRGYTPIPRYPVAARWRDDTDFVQASIYDFQPYVVRGEVEPPANPLVVPQFCLRFNDIDNVGLTGAHFTGFVMIGQHAFVPPEQFKQAQYFRDIHSWLKEGLGLPNDEITYHEDAWAGGGNFGPCMEFFSRGLELGNQVYMWYEKTAAGSKDLSIRVLDMGMGHERNAWFSQGTPTAYEATFPTVCYHLFQKTGVKPDADLIRRFIPYASYLNVDESADINKNWQLVADKVGMSVKDLRAQIMPLSGLFSIAEHMRTLLVALSDGCLPSNTGGSYNLRVLYRRANSILKEYNWNISLIELCELHARYLQPLFPELSEHLDEVANILDVEEKRFIEMRKRSRGMIEQMLQKPVTVQSLVQAYDTQGINPQLVAQVAKELGKSVSIPDDFYAKVQELHAGQESATATVKKVLPPEFSALDNVVIQQTRALYLQDYRLSITTATVMAKIGVYVVLDQTVFYPTSGGQLHDMGTVDDLKVVNVFKYHNLIVHQLEKEGAFMPGSRVQLAIDMQRRKQLAQHHTATHIVNAAARLVLGNHVNQAGAKKTLEKATLDITHYDNLTDEQLKRIEAEANAIVTRNIPIQLVSMPRARAERDFGMRIYQGGAVPGKELRIVSIKGIDVEACGGTHLNSTGEVGPIKVLRSSKVQDGVIRIEYSAGAALDIRDSQEKTLLKEAAAILGCDPDQVPGRADELFHKWKNKVKKGKEETALLTSIAREQGHSAEILAKAAALLQTQPEHVPKTLKRFLEELQA